MKHGKKGLRHRVEHNTVNTIADTKRFAELGVIASMQPTITGGEIYKRTRLGIERARRVDMVRTLLSRGVVLAWGTDWPVSPINPMYNLQELVYRIYPEQRLTMFEAIKYYTWGPAYAAFEEDIKGSLDVGKLAEDASLQSPHLPGPVTIGACSWLAARLVPDAMAQGAVLGASDLHFFFTAESSLLKAYCDLTA